MLIISELVEAMEEDRAGKPPFYYVSDGITYECEGLEIDQYRCVYDGEKKGEMIEFFHKPEGFTVELADAAIRMMDVSGCYGIQLVEIDNIVFSHGEKEAILECETPAALFAIAAQLCHPEYGPELSVQECFRMLIQYCVAKKIDIVKAIELKLEYNRTRSRMHGGKAY
ncbi:hypothetical protein phi1422_0004 [Bdellovibrio phage phi1422]|uniref:pyrophosphatase n=1 Tax=Bdellovibrio phage phi1422 TaxID=1127515 RepID=UPI0002536D03|nr:pyrophosphatase [Bdellovibrio phage phi1422]AFC22524.1 hypothetical protein phi1422_0004 [Bdellovibrio phage phi1422]